MDRCLNVRPACHITVWAIYFRQFGLIVTHASWAMETAADEFRTSCNWEKRGHDLIWCFEEICRITSLGWKCPNFDPDRFWLPKLLASLPLYYYHHQHYYHNHHHPTIVNTFLPYQSFSYDFKSCYKGIVFPLDPIKAFGGVDIIAPRFINFGRFISAEKNPPATYWTGGCEGYRASRD